MQRIYSGRALLSLGVLMFVGCGGAGGSIKSVKLEDGEDVFVVDVSIPPHGEGKLVKEDVSSNSKSIVKQVGDSWPILWEKMRDSIKETAKEYGVEVEYEAKSFLATLAELDEDVFMGDQADFMIEIAPNADAVPVWHFFFRDSEIVHSQPVF